MRFKAGLIGVLLLAFFAIQQDARAGLRRLVSEMLENLTSVALIERGFALDDGERVPAVPPDVP
ncbi:MAG: hypothetical protein ACE5FC_05955 [Myxococcota bacterium]